MFVVFDIETNGLLNTMNRIHLLTIKPMGKDVEVFREDNMINGLHQLMEFCKAGVPVYGHNIIKFDIPAIQKLHPWFTLKNPQDTLVLSRLMYADMGEADAKLIAAGKLPGKLWGSHSLEAWGYRLGEMKGEYEGDSSIYDIEARKATKWDAWNIDMETYGIQDAVVTEALVHKLAPWNYSQEAVELEHSVATIISRQERFGVVFDEAKASTLYATLVGEREELRRVICGAFPKHLVEFEKQPFTPVKSSARYGYVAGAPLTKCASVEFNPSSRQHIARVLKLRYGWTPKEHTETGVPKIDESVLEKMDYPEAKLLNQLFLVEKRIGQLAEGTQAWLKAVSRMGRIHGSVNTNGAVTGRMTHSSPNLAQVPSNSSYKGHECRELFGPPKGMVQIGADASGLELRCLAHFMARWDDGAYANAVLNGDIHTVNQEAAGLPTRNQAKTFIYGFLYGAGPEKIGEIVGKGRDAGLKLRKKFLQTLPALAELQRALATKAASKSIKGLDGRILSVRSPHAALNTLLQSAGALVMKKALVILDSTLQSRGLVPGVDYEFMLNIHDEFQIATKPEYSNDIASLAVASIRESGEHFKFRCRLDGESKVGHSWADTH